MNIDSTGLAKTTTHSDLMTCCENQHEAPSHPRTPRKRIIRQVAGFRYLYKPAFFGATVHKPCSKCECFRNKDLCQILRVVPKTCQTNMQGGWVKIIKLGGHNV